MFRIRVLLAWLLLAALPIQGFAAASMLYCAVERTAISQAAVDGIMDHELRESAHAMTIDQGPGDQMQDHAMAGPDSGAMTQGDQGMPGHGCSVGALSCQVAISGLEPVPVALAPPSAEPTPPVVRVLTRAITVPDKPPRA